MIETKRDGAGAIQVRSDVPGDVVVSPDGAVTLSPEAVGELVRIASGAPNSYPQPDARALLGGGRV